MKVAISACLLGETCRYDGSSNKNTALLEILKDAILIPFCPEAYAFGTPRPTMDLIQTSKGKKAFSNATGEDLSVPVIQYAKNFFEKHHDIDFYIGKDRSPSCGVCSSKLYDENRHLLSSSQTGLMSEEAQKQNIPCYDAEKYKGE